MIPREYPLIITFVLVLLILVSCAKKEVAEPALPEDAEQLESTENRSTVIEQMTQSKPKEQDPEKIETAVTYPTQETTKKFEPLSKKDSWFLVGGVTGERAYSVFVDPNTIAEKNGLVNSWSRLVFEETQRDEDGLTYKEVKIQSDVDCEARTYSYTDSKFYDGLGRIVESQPAPYEPHPIIEGTVSAQIADFVCGYELNRPK